MKGSRNEGNHQSKAPAINNNKPRPENKNSLDSRDNLELNDKGEGGGHNKKEVHSGQKSKDEHNSKQGTQDQEAS